MKNAIVQALIIGLFLCVGVVIGSVIITGRLPRYQIHFSEDGELIPVGDNRSIRYSSVRIFDMATSDLMYRIRTDYFKKGTAMPIESRTRVFTEEDLVGEHKRDCERYGIEGFTAEDKAKEAK